MDPDQAAPSGSTLFAKMTSKITRQSEGQLYIPHRRMTMDRPQNSRLKLVTFNCDLDLESALLSYGFCTSSH